MLKSYHFSQNYGLMYNDCTLAIFLSTIILHDPLYFGRISQLEQESGTMKGRIRILGQDRVYTSFYSTILPGIQASQYQLKNIKKILILFETMTSYNEEIVDNIMTEDMMARNFNPVLHAIKIVKFITCFFSETKQTS